MALFHRTSLQFVMLVILPLVSNMTALEFPAFRIPLTRVGHGKNLSRMQLIQRDVQRARARADRLSALLVSKAADSSFRTPILAGDGAFFMNLQLGTPPVPFHALVDTGSDLIWTQCKPCTTCFRQPTPIFDPALSSSFRKVACDNAFCKTYPNNKCSNGCQYSTLYGDDSSSQGYLATETFRFPDSAGKASVPNIGFGCGVDNEGIGLDHAAGIVGIGRGPSSLITQLKVPTFSYCLTSVNDTSRSTLFLGVLPQLKTPYSTIKSTPLVRNPTEPALYYVSLLGISVGSTHLNIPRDAFQLVNGMGGVIIDSGTTITSLQEDAYNVLKREFVLQTRLTPSRRGMLGLDTCFSLPNNDAGVTGVPALTFHFQGLDLALPQENYMLVDRTMGVTCLAIAPSGALSIFGNFQQQNMLVVHDLTKETVAFIPTTCNQL